MSFFDVRFTQCGNLQIFPPTIFLQKFRQIRYFTKELYCKSIWRKIFAVGEIFEIYSRAQELFYKFVSNFTK